MKLNPARRTWRIRYDGLKDQEMWARTDWELEVEDHGEDDRHAVEAKREHDVALAALAEHIAHKPPLWVR